ncbi:MAG: succinate dehydrogenase iron-sulfur subunit [candidate division WOR-3 bacterium]|uniref:Fumarate reductase iron-sulfur subunit n=1 Tax=candidate division WOR-3 bacterium TaxID=2052148 RepID=A0A7V4E1N9_UNCW3
MKEIIFKILRFDPEKDKKPYFKEYKISVKEGDTVLDALIYIKENIDSTLSIRYSCRMGICGSCGMIINSKPELACHTQIFELKSNIIEVRPMHNLPIIKDLVTNLSDYIKKHRSVKPYIIRDDKEEMDKPKREYAQIPDELLKFLQFSYCIKCGLCITQCPTCSAYEGFLGPFVLAQAYRYSIDSRDKGINERIKIVESSLPNCHFATACSSACPKGVDPALAIQLLKRISMLNSLGIFKKKISEIAPEPSPSPDKDKYPKAPPPSV